MCLYTIFDQMLLSSSQVVASVVWKLRVIEGIVAAILTNFDLDLK